MTETTKHLNTTAVLKNTYVTGEKIKVGYETPTIAIEPVMESRYDEAFTDDIVLLNDRKNTQEIIYDIFIKSPYAEKYRKLVEMEQSPEGGCKGKPDTASKIEKRDISEIFYYTKKELEKRKSLSVFETVIAINEFYDFNYDYIAKQIMTPKLLSELYQEYYENSMKNRMDAVLTQSLF